MRTNWIYLSMLLVVVSTAALAQNQGLKDVQSTSSRDIKDDTAHKHGWKVGGLASVNIGQGSSHNWAAGAETFSFSTAAFLNAFAIKKDGRWTWYNNIDLSYAMVNAASTGVRKTDDKIDFVSKASYSLNPHFDLSGVVNFRSQFTDGFEYNYFGHGLQHRISGFMAPAYLIVAPGVTWKPCSYFNLFVSPISGRWVFVTNNPYSYVSPTGVLPTGETEIPLATNYGVDPTKKVKFELGAFASATFAKEIMKNVTFSSRADFYSNYLKDKRLGDIDDGKSRPQNVSVFWTNSLIMKVNKWLNVTYNFDLIYDDDVRQFGADKMSAGTQTRSLLTVGFAVKF
ncbi:MAG TPA: DUF3078 domain-containing protein [Chitinophagaceae bacterium]